MVHKISIAVLASLVLHTTAASDQLPEQYKLQLKPAAASTACQLNWLKAMPNLTADGFTASKHHSYCREKYIKCIHNYGSRKAGPSTTQCGAWRDYCNAQGVWPGPHYLFKKKEKNDELQNFH